MWIYILGSLGIISRARIAKSYGNSTFNILRTCQTVWGQQSYKEGASALTLNRKGVLAFNREGWATSAGSGIAVISKDSAFGNTCQIRVLYFPNTSPEFGVANLI